MPYSASDVRSRELILRMLLCAPPKSGKAQPIDELVLTPAGWKEIGALQVGDQVVGSSGQPVNVVGVFPQGEKDVVRVEIDDGSTVRCCRDHLWLTATRMSRRKDGTMPWRVRTTAEMASDLDSRHYLPQLEAAVQFNPEADLSAELDPYYLGLLLGDGSFLGNIIKFWKNDEELLQAVEYHARLLGDDTVRLNHEAVNGSGCSSVRLRRSDCHVSAMTVQFLRSYGLMGHKSEHKFVPEMYLRSSPENRLKLLRGLCDTDGHACKNMGSSVKLSTQAEYSTSSPQLRDAVVEIVRSLGGRAYVRSKSTPCLPAWSVMISFSDGTCPFACKRKASKWLGTRSHVFRRRIVDVHDAGRAECVCIKVDADDQLYVTRDYVLTHNTTTAVMTSPGPVFVLNTDGKGGLDPVALRGGDFVAEDIKDFGAFQRTMIWLAQRPKEFQTVVFDNITTFSMMIEDEVKKEVKDNNFAYHRELKGRLLHTIRSLVALPQHLIVIGQIDSADKNVGASFGHILAVDGKAKTLIPAIMQDWVWIEPVFDPVTQELKHEFLLAPQGNWTKGARSVKDILRMEANVTKFIELATAQKKIEAPKPATPPTPKPQAVVRPAQLQPQQPRPATK